MVAWVDELNNIQEQLDKGVPLTDIGSTYGVTKQRIYQVLQKYNLSTPLRKRKSALIGKTPKHYWLNKMLTVKKVPLEEREELLATYDIPDVCPVFGIPLNYNGSGKQGWSRDDSSPSVDRIDSTKGYTKDNIQIISWRANRIKNDSTPEELRRLADYMENICL